MVQPNQHPDKIDVKQLSQAAPNIKARAELFAKEGFVMPSSTSGCITNNWLDGIEDRRFFCIRQWQSNYWTNGLVASARRCIKAPTRQEIYTELLRVEMEDRLRFGLNPASLPDRPWMLTTLATVRPEHPFFKSNYKPVGRSLEERFQPIIRNPNGMYTNHVVQNGRGHKATGRAHINITPEERTQMQLAKAEAMVQKKQQ